MTTMLAYIYRKKNNIKNKEILIQLTEHQFEYKLNILNFLLLMLVGPPKNIIHKRP